MVLFSAIYTLKPARGAAPILLLALGLGLALLLCLLPAVQPQPTLTHTPDTQRLLRTHNTHTFPTGKSEFPLPYSYTTLKSFNKHNTNC
jgi:hypothetical protein